MSYVPLTRRQCEVLQYLRAAIATDGYAPLFIDIQMRFGWSSTGTVHDHLRMLERKGYIVRHHQQQRGIELVEQPSVQHDLRDAFEAGARWMSNLLTPKLLAHVPRKTNILPHDPRQIDLALAAELHRRFPQEAR